MNNNSNFAVNRIISIAKYLFHTSNIILIIFYLYPGSILGCYIYNDCQIQPQLTSNFVVSSNHVFSFFIISLLGFVAYSKKKVLKKIIIYVFFISVFLELTHIAIPKRSFQAEDLAGNIAGVVISLIIFLIFKFRKKNE